MSKYDHIKQTAYEANMLLPKLSLVSFTFGNVSTIDRELGVFAIKPSGVAYNELNPEKMVIVDLDGNVVKGKLRPSSDTKTHAVLYKHWENIGGISHTHSTYATSWAQAQRDIPIFGTTHADHITVDIPCAPPMSNEMIKGDYDEFMNRIESCWIDGWTFVSVVGRGSFAHGIPGAQLGSAAR